MRDFFLIEESEGTQTIFHILLDELCFVKGIQGKEDWCIKPIVQEILDVANMIDLVDFSFTPLTFNRHVHSLAKLCFVMDEDFCWD